LKAST
jgi:hypothetical protein